MMDDSKKEVELIVFTKEELDAMKETMTLLFDTSFCEKHVVVFIGKGYILASLLSF